MRKVWLCGRMKEVGGLALTPNSLFPSSQSCWQIQTRYKTNLVNIDHQLTYMYLHIFRGKVRGEKPRANHDKKVTGKKITGKKSLSICIY